MPQIPSLAEFLGSPVVLVFHSARWDPAAREHIESYNRVIASLAGTAGARLVHVGPGASWRSLQFESDDLTLPVLAGDPALASALGLESDSGVVVLDETGAVRWKHDGRRPLAAGALIGALTTGSTAPSVGHSEGGEMRDSESRGWSRREFVATALAVVAALAIEPRFSGAPVALAETEAADHAARRIGATRRVTLTVNGHAVALDLEPRVTLLDALRDYTRLTGTKKGCDHGQCGACTVHIDGRRTLSCLTFAAMHEGRQITTIEGLAHGDQLHPMQQAFITHDGFQCGYCTSGQIMSATAVVNEPWGAGDDDVREAMSGNICRCGAYPGIVAAIQDVRATRRANQ